MIHKIEIENFLSIRDRQVLDLRAPANAPKNDYRLAECWRGATERAPKVVALFGANGSGKSNVLRALSFANWFISLSFFLRPDQSVPHEPFNDEESLNAPTIIKIWAAGEEKLEDKALPDAIQCPYCYELKIKNGARRQVLSEGIYYWPSSSGRITRLIERSDSGPIKAASSFNLGNYKKGLEKVLRPNASVISTLAQFNHPFAISIIQWAFQVRSNIAITKFEPDDQSSLRQYVEDPVLFELASREIQRIDVGVRGIDIVPTEEGRHVLFRHEGLKFPMPFHLESQGTQQFLKIYPALHSVLLNGGIAIIDELDSAIHPMLLPEIIRWFHDPQRNPHNAQLWMSCHNASLLEELSKDEIVFCEKDLRGRTEIYSLNSMKSVRRDDNYYKKYLGGVFGAVPKLG